MVCARSRGAPKSKPFPLRSGADGSPDAWPHLAAICCASPRATPEFSRPEAIWSTLAPTGATPLRMGAAWYCCGASDRGPASIRSAPMRSPAGEIEINVLELLIPDVEVGSSTPKTLSSYLTKIARLPGYLSRAKDPPAGQHRHVTRPLPAERHRSWCHVEDQ